MRKQLMAAALISVLAALMAVATAKAAAPGNTTSPTVSGTAKVGDTLTVSNGEWTNSPTSYSYQWQRCTSSSSCANIGGATNKTYTIVAADAGHTLRALVTATNADGSATVNSNQSDMVPTSGGTTTTTGVPANTLKPVILGDAFVGQRLTATNGRWTGSPTSFSYRWMRCNGAGGGCFPIVGATGKTYGVTFADVYSTIGVWVTAKNAAGTRTAHSDTTDLVQPLEPVATPGNKAPTLKFVSLRRVGVRVYARFTVCDDGTKAVSVIERDTKVGALAYTRKFSVTPSSCTTATRSWTPASRFRTKGRFVVTLRAVDKSGASSKFVTRSLVKR